jgi:hypothetical protein
MTLQQSRQDQPRLLARGAFNFLEIECSLINNRPHESADEMLTLFVNGGRSERLGDGVDAPTKPASLSFPYVREP